MRKWSGVAAVLVGMAAAAVGDGWPARADTPATAPTTQWGKPVESDIQAGKTVTIKSSDRDIEGWLVEPKISGTHPSVVLIHDIFGMTPFIKAQADVYAHQGYTVLVPNLYSREQNGGKGLNAQSAWVAYDHMTDRQALDDIHGAIEYLEAGGQPTADQPLGMVGVDMGGGYAMLASGKELRVSATVNFYGRILYPDTDNSRPLSPVEAVKNLSSPLLSFYGSDDPQAPKAHVEQLKSWLSNNPNKIYFEVVKLPGVGHGFIDPGRQGYNKGAAQEAAEKTKVFLARYLRAEPKKEE